MYRSNVKYLECGLDSQYRSFAQFYGGHFGFTDCSLHNCNISGLYVHINKSCCIHCKMYQNIFLDNSTELNSCDIKCLCSQNPNCNIINCDIRCLVLNYTLISAPDYLKRIDSSNTVHSFTVYLDGYLEKDKKDLIRFLKENYTHKKIIFIK